MLTANRRFVTSAERVVGHSPWALEEWLCRDDVVANQELLMVRVTIDPGGCHGFHTHPHREELIYVLSVQAEQWVGREYRILKSGDVALIPTCEVHGTNNPFDQPGVFLGIF